MGRNHLRKHSTEIKGLHDSSSFFRSRMMPQIFLATATIVAIVGLTWISKQRDSIKTIERKHPSSVISTFNPTHLHTTFDVEPRTLHDLLQLPVAELKKVDIARMNLLCATGLPGAEHLDSNGIEHALAILDKWASRVREETDRHLYRVTDPRYAKHYRYSEAYFRAEFLLQVLQQDLGIKYDTSAANNFEFKDSRVAFIHGMIPTPGSSIADTPGGTCASMPVMYVAIGRRLGYPLKLVSTSGHLFVLWDGKEHANPTWRERFNIEGSGEGFASYTDDYYKSWPYTLSERDIEENRYLVALTPSEEFAAFLAARGHCGVDNREFSFAARCYENAYGYDPTRPAHRAWFMDAAIRTGYKPVLPTLAKQLDRERRIVAAARHSSSVHRLPMPGAHSPHQFVDIAGLPDASSARRIGLRRTPAGLQDSVSSNHRLNHDRPPQPSFGSQP